MKHIIVVAFLFAGALAAPSETREKAAESKQDAVESNQMIAAEDSNVREKKSYYKVDYYKPDYYKPEYHGSPANAIYPEPPGPCAVPVLVSCKTHLDYGKLEYKPHYSPEYKPYY